MWCAVVFETFLNYNAEGSHVHGLFVYIHLIREIRLGCDFAAPFHSIGISGEVFPVKYSPRNKEPTETDC